MPPARPVSPTATAVTSVPHGDSPPVAAAKVRQVVMKHSSSRELFAHWNACRGVRPAPERGDIDPGAIRGALGDSFILALEGSEAHFRLAGTRVCALFCRELKNFPFLDLWSEESHAAVDALIHAGTDESVGSVAGAIGHVTDGEVDLELLLLPLSHRGRQDARLIGILAPLRVPYWLGTQPLRKLVLGVHRHVGPTIAAPKRALRIVLPTERRSRHGLVVYPGGRS